MSDIYDRVNAHQVATGADAPRLGDLDLAVRQLLEGRRNHPNLDPEWVAVKHVHLDAVRREMEAALRAERETPISDFVEWITAHPELSGNSLAQLAEKYLRRVTP